MRLIDADALIEFIENRYEITWDSETYEGGIKDACSDILEKIDNMETIKPESNCSESPNNWVPCTPETMPDPNQNVIMQCRGKRYPSGYRYFQTIGCYIPPLTVKSEEKWNDGDSEDVEVYDENTDTYYCKEGWYEETTQGDGDCMSWYMNADVIAWMPTPPYQPKEDANG